MRNLKRALSLALASVMLLGMMVVGSSAKGIDDFTDSSDIVNQDAVAVTSAIGMFEGYEDGSFKPENVVTRAEMAVIICTMLYGAGVNVDQFAETNVFTDVPAWAEGYVNLCSSLGIVAGVGDGKFDPNATVTTAQAVLMLCRTLGYFQNAADFGSDWMLAATAKGTQLGLYGDLKLTANAGLTRDDVAELVFNALTKAVPVQYNELLGVYYNENQGIIYSLEFNYLQTLGYKNFDLVYRTDTETIYGRPGTTWGTGSYNVPTNAGTTQKDDYLTEEGGLIADKVRMLDKDEIITVPNTPDYVYTNGTSQEDVYDDLGSTVCNDTKGADKYTWTLFINGEEQDKDEDEIIPVENEDDKWDYTDKGSVTEVYIDDYTLDVTVVEINYYLGEVSKVDEDDDTITVRALSDEPKLDDDSFATTDFDEDDYVVFTVDYNDDEDFYICELMAPETITGEVSRVQNNANSKNFDKYNSYVRLDGEDTKYYYTALDTHMCYDVSEDGKDEHPTLNEDYIFYLTPAGYILGFEPAEETVDQYLYVQDSDEELRDWVARVVLPDATTAKVDLKEGLKGTKADDKVWYVNENGDGAWTKYEDDNGDPVAQGSKVKWVQNKDLNGDNRTNIDNRIWKYTVNDSSVYTLTSVDTYVLGAMLNDDDYADRDFTAEIKNGKAYITEIHEGADGKAVEVDENDLIVDRQTIFVDVEGEVAYVGYKEVPNVSNALLACVVDDGVAEVVFILAGDIYDTNATYFMLTSLDRDSGKDGDAGEFWKYEDSYVNGRNTELQITYAAVEDLTGDEDGQLETGVLYKATKTIGDGEFIDELEEIGEYDNYLYDSGEDTDQWGVVAKRGTGEAVGDNAFWIENPKNDHKTVKYDTDEETVYVTVREIWTLNNKGVLEFDSWKIDDGKISDLKAIDNDKKVAYSTKQVHVVTDVDDNTARLVYIFWTEEELGTPVDVNFVANFANVDITVNGKSVNDVDNNGKETSIVNKNSDTTVVIEPKAGQRLTKVTLNGAEQTIEDGKCTITIKDITKDVDIKVETEEIVAATVTVEFKTGITAGDAIVTINGEALVDNPYVAEVGDDVTITVEQKYGETKIGAVVVNGVEKALGTVFSGKIAGDMTIEVYPAEQKAETAVEITATGAVVIYDGTEYADGASIAVDAAAGQFVRFSVEADNVTDPAAPVVTFNGDALTAVSNDGTTYNYRAPIREGENELVVVIDQATYALTTSLNGNGGNWLFDNASDVFGKEYKMGEKITVKMIFDTKSATLAIANVAMNGTACTDIKFENGVDPVAANIVVADTDTMAKAQALVDADNLYKDASGTPASMEDWGADPDGTFYYADNLDKVTEGEKATLEFTYTMPAANTEITSVTISA